MFYTVSITLGRYSFYGFKTFTAIAVYSKMEELTRFTCGNDLVIKCGYHLNTGFLSTPNLTRVLCEYGYENTAYKLLLQDTRPSWLYAVEQGATTIWETWDVSLHEIYHIKLDLLTIILA